MALRDPLYGNLRTDSDLNTDTEACRRGAAAHPVEHVLLAAAVREGDRDEGQHRRRQLVAVREREREGPVVHHRRRQAVRLHLVQDLLLALGLLDQVAVRACMRAASSACGPDGCRARRGPPSGPGAACMQRLLTLERHRLRHWRLPAGGPAEGPGGVSRCRGRGDAAAVISAARARMDREGPAAGRAHRSWR